jgi:hypothetical protein
VNQHVSIQGQDALAGSRVAFGHVNHGLALLDAAGGKRGFGGLPQIELRHVAEELNRCGPNFFTVGIHLIGDESERPEGFSAERFDADGTHGFSLKIRVGKSYCCLEGLRGLIDAVLECEHRPGRIF